MKILQMLKEDGLLTPAIASKFSIEWATELDFSQLDEKHFHLTEEYLKLISGRCSVRLYI